MVVNIKDTTWRYAFTGPVNLVFASVSARGDRCSMQVRFNDELVEAVTTSVPHSWWTAAGNPLWPSAHAEDGDVLEVAVVGDADLRIDVQ